MPPSLSSPAQVWLRPRATSCAKVVRKRELGRWPSSGIYTAYIIAYLVLASAVHILKLERYRED